MIHSFHTRKFRDLSIVSALAVLLSLLPLLSPFQQDEANAADANAFDAGYIISDANFYNSNALTATEIQSFLNARVPTCHPEWDSNPADITCLKDYRTTTVAKSANAYCSGYTGGLNQSAAEIIDGVARSCGISQKVLLVMLQKEQGLVTNVYPSSRRYKSAMGMGCPDTAACDSQYYGFFNQVYGAAQQYKIYQAKPASYGYRAGRNNYIQWSPTAACGGSTVYIQNQATAALYIYTPYQPNTAAKNAGYGTGDGCSSYGNRNFYLYYTDWFGSPTADLGIVGYVDDVSLTSAVSSAAFHLTGWTYDRANSDSSIQMHAYVTRLDDNSQVGTPFLANSARPDVNTAFSITGNHGFDVTLPVTKAGTYRICLYGVNNNSNSKLGCRDIAIDSVPSPSGYLDSVSLATGSDGAGALNVRGWAYDPGVPDISIPVHTYITQPDGKTIGYSTLNNTATIANQTRTDVNNVMHIIGNHGYSFTIPITQTGTYKICTYAIGTDWRNKDNNPQLGCKSLTIASPGSPFGYLDIVSATTTPEGTGALNIRGWAYDPGVPDISIPVHTYITQPDGKTIGYSTLNNTATIANQTRTDVNNVMHIIGNHGYSFTIPITQTGTYKICTYAIGTDWRNKDDNPQLGCKNVRW